MARRNMTSDDADVKQEYDGTSGVPVHPTISRGLYTANEIRQFKAAVERRVGVTAATDWKIIRRLYKRASDLALNETGANDREGREDRKYQRRFSELIAVLPPISDSEHTAKRYRAALLNMAEHAEEFDRWCEEMKPVVESPPRLWDAFEAYRRGDKPQDGDDNDDEEGDDNESRASQHEQDLIDLRVEFDAKLKDVYAELRSLEGIVKSLSTLPKSQLL
jgi:hypothetical protein